jgi:RNA polymerase sigma factor (sigma-70 family)
LIFSIPVRLGYSVDDASEIFQEVCLKLLSELSRLREPRTLPAWLVKVTSHECLRWKQKLARKGFRQSGTYDESTLQAPEMPESMLLDLEQEIMLQNAIAELDVRCRRLIEMLFFVTPTVPYEEVATSLGIATGSVGFIRMRCLARLRRQLEDRGFR